MTGAVLITPRSLTEHGDGALSALNRAGYGIRLGPRGRTPTEEELLDLLPGCVGWIAGIEPVSERVIRAAVPELRVISRNGVGTDNLPLAECERLGVAVRRADGANAQGVAELAIGLMIAALRHLPYVDACLKRGQWARRVGSELRGSVVGVVGFGSVGRTVAAGVAGLGASVTVYDPIVPAGSIGADVDRVELSELLRTAKLVTLHCPPNADGSPLLDREAIATMQTGACLINTARASLVDETAVLDALKGERLLCYATDVFGLEPPGLTDLVSFDRVIATPHIGGFTRESAAKAASLAVDNLLDALRESANVRDAI